MLRFIFTRVLQAVPVLFIIATATFFMVRTAPGGPFDREKKVPDAVKVALEAHYGMDRPLLVQYFDYMKSLLRGDLGPSFKYPNRSVNELIATSFPVSLELGCWGLLVALTIGLTAGLLAAIKPNTAQDYLPMTFSMAGICLPLFVLGPLLIAVFALKLQWYNASGWFFPSDRVLPALTLGAYYAAYVARLTRGGMLDVLNQDFIRTARAKGASESQVIFKHALKGGILPVVSFLGPAVAGMLAGSFVIETIFQIPGLGRFFVLSASNRDYTMLIGTVLFFSTLIMVLNLIVDIVLVWLNPRLRFD